MPPGVFGITTAWGVFFFNIGVSVAISAGIYILTTRPSISGPTHNQLESARDPNAPWRVVYGQTRIGGTIVWVENAYDESRANNYFWIIYALAAHPLNAVLQHYVEDEEIEVTLNGSWYEPSTGQPFEGKIAWTYLDGTHATGFAGLGAASAVYDADVHKCLGHHMCLVSIVNDGSVFPNGLPNLTWEVQGKKDVYDPRDTTNKYTSNAALILADYLTESRLGLGADYATEVNEAALTAAANVCEEQVELDDETTEDRYQINGVYTMDSTPEAILANMVAAIGGQIQYIGGEWHILPGVYREPTIEITEEDIVGPIRVQPRLSRREVANAVKGSHPSSLHNYVVVGYPPVVNSTYATEDGEQIFMERDYAFVTSHSQCQRLSKIELERSRQQITVAFSTNLMGYQLQVGDTVQLTLSRYGWSEKVFEVASCTLGQDESSDSGIAPFTVALVLRETASGVFDWNDGEETTVDLAEDTALENIHQIDEPENLVLTSDETTALYAQDNTVIPRIKVEWDPPTESPHVYTYEVRYRLASGYLWQRRPYTFAGDYTDTHEAYIDGVTDGQEYEVAVRSASRYGTVSAWVTDTITVSTAHQQGVEGNMIYGGDFNASRLWTRPLTGTQTNKSPAQAYEGLAYFIDAADEAKTRDGSTTTYGTLGDPGVGNTRYASWSFASAGSGSVVGMFTVYVSSLFSKSNAYKAYYSVDGGSTWIYFANLTGGNLRTVVRSSTIVAADYSNLRVRVETTRNDANVSGAVRCHEMRFVEISGPFGLVADCQCIVRGNGTDTSGYIYRPFPGNEPVSGPVVFKGNSSSGVQKIWCRADSTPTHDFEIVLVDPVTETEWTLITVDKDRIPTTWSRAFALKFDPTTDVPDVTDIYLRSLSTVPIHVAKARCNRGNIIFPGWSPNIEEVGYQGTEQFGQEQGFPPGPWTATPKESVVS